MDDIVKRIRQQSYFGPEPYEAANEIELLRQRVQELTAERDGLLAAAVMAVEMIEYEKHERRHVRWKLNDAITSVKELK